PNDTIETTPATAVTDSEATEKSPRTDADAAGKAPTKNEVVLPSPKSFIGRTIAEIKEVLHIDTPEAKDKSDQE
ncbi:unnamed protein product, partial [Rotaria magnacalcarata]